ncbi:MAG: TIGR02466 family protein [Asticcacaulis sp.]
MKEVPAPATLMQMFVTEVYRTDLAGSSADPLITRLEAASMRLARTDTAGREWATRQGYMGYTSYESIADLRTEDPAFTELVEMLDVQVTLYARLIELDLRGKSPRLAAMWINLLDQGGAHSAHIHTHSVFSGTLYLNIPTGAGALQFEDPRLGFMMCAPQRLPSARPYRQTFVPVPPSRGTLLLWESWLRHEVSTNQSPHQRLSISFNYDL